MKRTYEEILDSMKSAYFNECGFVVEKDSTTYKDYEILASELYSLSCYGDYIFKQAFVQSATGENLDMLGELRGCKRKTAAYAAGVLTFSASEVSEEDIVIPSKTVCSAAERPFIQFVTAEDAVIEAGQTQVSVNARAINTGYEYNVDSGSISVMVNAPAGVSSVTNIEAFDGGFSPEDDAHYRKRIINNYSITQNGINCTSYEN